MIIEPTRIWAGLGQVVTRPSREGELLIKCEVTAPKSMKGRKALFVVPADVVTEVLKAARDVAIEARSKPMEAAS